MSQAARALGGSSSSDSCIGIGAIDFENRGAMLVCVGVVDFASEHSLACVRGSEIVEGSVYHMGSLSILDSAPLQVSMRRHWPLHTRSCSGARYLRSRSAIYDIGCAACRMLSGHVRRAHGAYDILGSSVVARSRVVHAPQRPSRTALKAPDLASGRGLRRHSASHEHEVRGRVSHGGARWQGEPQRVRHSEDLGVRGGGDPPCAQHAHSRMSTPSGPPCWRRLS